MLESGEVRKRLRQTIETARREAAERRAAFVNVEKAYDAFLENHAVPVFRQMASALKAEGHVFQVLTPAGMVRLVSEREPDDFLEIVFELSGKKPVVLGRSSYVRGSRLTTAAEPVREGAHVSELEDEDVLNWMLRVILPLVER